VGEPSVEEAVEILKGLRERYETHHKLKISDEAIYEAVNLSKRYIPDRFLPDKAIDLLDEAASKLRLSAHMTPPQCLALEGQIAKLARDKEDAILLQNFEMAARLRDEEQALQDEYQKLKVQWDASKNESELTVSTQDIADIVTQWTGIPLREVVKTENEKLMHMEEVLNSSVIGQASAIAALTRAIRRGRMGLKDPRRPIGSFLFLGPTGVGKTELTRALSQVLFGDTNAMIRLDMSEYMEKHSVSKLIGSPPGYVGYEEGGQLTEKVRRRPYSVVLFDEIEKGHPDIYNLLLQILEDGVLSDSQGRQVSFKNTILIMTSNVGSSTLESAKTVGFLANEEEKTQAVIQEHTMQELKKVFRPEFLNRIDEMIVFNRLTQKDAENITRLFLTQLAERVQALRIEISFDSSVVDLIVRHGFDPKNGARNLRRTVTREVEDRLSEAMLAGKIAAGMHMRVLACGEEIKLEQCNPNK
jgi:ATP-dependent Clp protease ATP-binding subunit ClpC